MQKSLIDRDGVLLDLIVGDRLHPRVEFSEQDATQAILLLNQIGFDTLIFGWKETNGELRETDGSN